MILDQGLTAGQTSVSQPLMAEQQRIRHKNKGIIA
jgi:hypothetical protein